MPDECICQSGRVSVHGMLLWFTNLRHGYRRKLPELRTMDENLTSNVRLRKHLLKRYGQISYPRYVNFDAIEVPFIDAIPSDYHGAMGVPSTVLMYDIEGLFEIVGRASGVDGAAIGIGVNHTGRTDAAVKTVDGLARTYERVIVRQLEPERG